MKITFSIQGEFITQLAREQFFCNHNLKAAVELLRESIQTDQLTQNEITMLALQILNGNADIKGTYPDEDYGIVFKENADPDNCLFDKISAAIEQEYEKRNSLQKDYDDLMRKYLFVCSELSEYELEDINSKYHEEYDKSLFEDIETSRQHECAITPTENSALKSFLSQKRREAEYDTDNDYGWLAPNGEYYPMPWGEHEDWAASYLKEHYPFENNANLYKQTTPEGQTQYISGGDVLIYSLHWVLIDNPYHGEGIPHYDESRNLTKEQKSFLYDYFIERNRHREANALYKD